VRTALEEQLQSTGVQGGAQGDKDLVNSIPKPPSTAGKDYSIQIEVVLAGTVKKSEKYKAIQVCHTSDTWAYTNVPSTSTTLGISV
jgi:hypothetical protein